MLQSVIDEVIDVDVLIIGAGGAGLRAAIEADVCGAKVAIVCKGVFRKCGVTLMAGSSYQAAFGYSDSRDNPRVHFKDTVVGGCYIANQRLVKVFARKAPQRAIDLVNFGVEFMTTNGAFLQVSGPGQTYPRTLISAGPHAGVRYVNALSSEVRRRNIRVIDETFVTHLLTENNKVVGVMALDVKRGLFKILQAKSSILASGGGMAIYPITTASTDATGDGYALAYMAGAELVDMEFCQFGPFALYWPNSFRGRGWPADIRYSPILRDHRFLNSLGEPFMERYDPINKDWATRDVISRAMALEVRQGRGSPNGGVYLSVTHLPEELIEEFIRTHDSLTTKLQRIGIDIRKKNLEVGPGAHYFMGGIRINEKCESSLAGLFVAGECAGGLDGANRLDHNAIPWTQVSGVIAGRNAAKYSKTAKRPCVDDEEVRRERERLSGLLEAKDGERPHTVKEELRNVMWHCAGVIRSEKELLRGAKEIEKINRELGKLTVTAETRTYNMEWVEMLELINMAKVSEMIIKAAHKRTESRGAHFRLDHPDTDNRNWLKNILVTQVNGAMQLSIDPPIITEIWPQAS